MGCIVHGATESQTRPRHLYFHFYNSSVLRTKTLIKPDTYQVLDPRAMLNIVILFYPSLNGYYIGMIMNL